MGGTDADRSGITARPKPPLPPKPPLVTKQNGIIHSPTHSFSGILSTDEETVVQDSGTVMKEKETKENGIHDVKIDSVLDSIESNIFSSGVTVHNMERSIPQAELSSVNNTLPPLNMSAASSDRTNTRTVTRGRPSRRASRHSTENGESGDEACCIRFAGMLRTKAVDMASKSKILPPAKPPKPDSLVKYKGRRRKGSQQNDMPCQRSVGDDFSIDGSRHGVRFVDDDETESSTDYKDFDENSVFLLELACHCDAQNISKGTGILTEGVESGYYTSDVVKTDEEANVSDSCQPVDKKDSVHETDKQIMISPIPEQMKTSEEESFPQLVEEKAKIVSCQETGSQVIDSENSILTADAGHAISFEGPPDSENFSDSLISSTMILEQKSEEKNNSDICVETIVNKDHEPSPVILSALVTDSTYTETKEIAPEIVKESIQKPKRVKSPPRPPPPQIVKKQPQPIIEAEQIVNKCVITKDELNSDGETATEETKKEESTFAQTLVNSMPVEETILVSEVPQTKKRVTSPPRPPPPKIKEIVLDTKEIMPLSVEKVDDKINHTEQTDDSPNKKQPPPIPTKPERKRKERLHEKSSLEPLDLSTRDDISQCTKPLSLSPKTFPRSGKQGTRPSQVKKMELKPREQTESKGKPVMTTVVRNTYLEGLQPLPLLKSSSENKLLPTRPPPPILTKTEETNSSSNVDSAVEQNACLLLETSGDISETSKSVDGINTVPSIQNNIVECKENLNVIKDDVIECKENLNEVKDQSLDECLVNAIIDSSIDIQEDHSPVTDTSLQDTKIDDKLETIATQNAFVRDEIQSSTWPTAAERKKRKEMKSPPRPPPPNRDAIMETFSRQTYETSSLDSRGRKRIKSPPRPSPPSRGKLPLKIEEELASSSVSQSEEKTNITDSNDKNTAKRIKSPPRPPPPVYEKLPLKRIIAEQYQINLTNEAEKLPSDTNSTLLAKSSSETHQSENDLPKITKEHVAHVPLATEETVADEIDLASSSENKKRVISPPRPPPPVYEKLSLRRTDKPIIPSLTTPRRKKPSETSDSQKQFMSLQRPSDVSGHWNSNQFSPNTNVLHEYEEIHPPNEESLDSQKKRPKAPPRIKRNRSRTVEVVAVTPKPEERKRRSHSLTESDVSKKLEDRGLLSTPQQSEIKKLYTTVQKEHGKTKLQEVDINEDSRTTPGYDKMKLRPLPPPPPPPRCRSRSSMSQSPGSTCLNTSVSEEVKLDVTPENASYRTNQIVKQIDFPEYDENANISFPSKTEEQKKDETSHNKVTTDKCSDEKITHGLENQSDKSNVTHRKSHSPSSTRSKSPSPSKHRSCSSWYDESDVSGDLGDVDTSSSIKGSAEGINKDESESTMLKQKHVKTKTEQSRTSTFYCDLEDDAFHDCSSELPQVETERPLSSSSLVEKSVQTSPERELALRSQEKNDHSDDTDDLLDRARTVQMELCLMLERRKRRKGQSHGGEDDTKSSCSYTPSPKSTIPRSKVKIVSNPPESDSFANIESPLTVSPVDGRCQLPSTRSSNSELGWQVLSSDESDEDSGELSPTLQKKKQKKAFQIANEIMTSEETFIKSLKLLNEDFREAVEKANKERGGTVISEEAVNSFLKYFPQLQNLNENLLGELKDRIEHWEETGKIADVIVKIGPFLKLYCSYIRDFDAMEAALDDARRKYPLFDQVTKEFESGPLCKLALKHYMLRPIQRIPLYRLLLQRYLHNLTPDSPDYNDTVTALEIVSDVAERANKTLRQGDDFRKLISIQNSLFGQHEVIRPGRVFLKEGELMKLSRKEMQPRWFILFNDSLLYLTSMQQGLFKVNNELPLAGMKVHIPQQQDYQNEFSIISVTRSFTLAARSLEERQEWIDALNEAIEENASKRNTFANVMIQQKRREEQVDGGFTLGKQAPVWIPDARVTMCQLCTSEFTITFRRHHCRACGKVVCSLCSANQAPLQYRNFNVARVCDECFKKLHEEFEAADPIEKITEESGSCSEVIETDSDSPYAMASIKAQFKGNAKNAGKKNKRQLPSVLKEVCANDQGSTLSGYLYRRHRKYWKRFWFVLKDKVLYTYKASEDVAALESVPLLGFRVEVFTKPFEGVEAELLFQLTHPGQFPIVFHADTIGSTERWVQAMQHATILE